MNLQRIEPARRFKHALEFRFKLCRRELCAGFRGKIAFNGGS
jgi:hypothetical protein